MITADGDTATLITMLSEEARSEGRDAVLSGQERLEGKIDDLCDAVRRALLGPPSNDEPEG